MPQHLKGNGTVLVPPLTELNDDIVRDLINDVFVTAWHVVGVMPRDQGGVVDPGLRVYGTKNVRVVDESIVPLQVGGNTVSLTYAIAEKAAGIIKQDMNGTILGTPQAYVGVETNIVVGGTILLLLIVSLVLI